MANEAIVEIFDAIAIQWDEVRHAANAVECALPRQMSDAIHDLVCARQQMDATMRAVSQKIAVRQSPNITREKDHG